jgi:hypothetical protein
MRRGMSSGCLARRGPGVAVNCERAAAAHPRDRVPRTKFVAKFTQSFAEWSYEIAFECCGRIAQKNHFGTLSLAAARASGHTAAALLRSVILALLRAEVITGRAIKGGYLSSDVPPIQPGRDVVVFALTPVLSALKGK